MQVRAEDDVFPDDAVEFERRQPGDKHHRATGGCSLNSSWRTRNWRRREEGRVQRSKVKHTEYEVHV